MTEKTSALPFVSAAIRYFKDDCHTLNALGVLSLLKGCEILDQHEELIEAIEKRFHSYSERSDWISDDVIRHIREQRVLVLAADAGLSKSENSGPFHVIATEIFKSKHISLSTGRWLLGVISRCTIPAGHDDLVAAIKDFFPAHPNTGHDGHITAIIQKVEGQKKVDSNN